MVTDYYYAVQQAQEDRARMDARLATLVAEVKADPDTFRAAMSGMTQGQIQALADVLGMAHGPWIAG